jgi:hypothetical protein
MPISFQLSFLSLFLGSGIGRSDENVFLFEGDIEMNKTNAIEIIQNKGPSRGKRAVIRTRGQNLWPRNVPYAIDGSLRKSYSKCLLCQLLL